MQACGNDYIYIDCALQPECVTFANTIDKESVVQICRSHFGVGADGLVFILPAQGQSIRMVMYNSDGSRGRTCGNALRCISHYLNIVHHASFPLRIATDSGIRVVNKIADNTYTVDMGVATLAGYGDGRGKPHYHLIDVGNLHAVHEGMVHDLTSFADVVRRQSGIEGLNVECYRLTHGEIEMQVCEAGTGITLGCGSGACAVAFAACQQNNYTFGIPIGVNMSGGRVQVTCHKDGRMVLCGDAHIVFTGEFETPWQS